MDKKIIWDVSLSGSEWDGCNSYRIIATKESAKKHLLRIALEHMNEEIGYAHDIEFDDNTIDDIVNGKYKDIKTLEERFEELGLNCPLSINDIEEYPDGSLYVGNTYYDSHDDYTISPEEEPIEVDDNGNLTEEVDII